MARIQPQVHKGVAYRPRRAGQLVAEALVAEGVDLVFGIPGSHILDIYDGLADFRDRIRHVTCKHENNAAWMAEMYGRLTGRPGVYLATAGPGAINSMSAVAQAYTTATPLVSITGSPLTDDYKEALHAVDDPDFTAKMFRPITKWSYRVRRLGELPEALRRAFAIARSGRTGPTHVEIPWDILQSEPAEFPEYRPAPVRRRRPDPQVVRTAAEILRRARCPVICCGVGVVRSRAQAEVGELATRVGAPVVVTGDGYGALTDDHPLYVGVLVLGAFGRDPFPAAVFRKADAVLAVGLRTGTQQAEAIAEAAPNDYVFIGFDDGLNLPRRAAAAQVCDIGLFLRALLRELADFKRDPDPGLVGLIGRYRQALRAGLAADLENYRQARPIHFGLAVKELFDRLDEDALVVTDVGVHSVWGNQLARIRRPDSLQTVGRWAEMGFALPGAIAAKLVFPSRTVVGITGDGCFLMSDNDFATALQEGANILMLIMNDSQYGMIYKMQRDRFERAYASELYTPNFARYAEAFGAAGFRVEDPADLPAVIEKALRASRDVPTVVDVVSGYTYPYPPVDRIVADLASAL